MHEITVRPHLSHPQKGINLRSPIVCAMIVKQNWVQGKAKKVEKVKRVDLTSASLSARAFTIIIL